jgi:hypothetical protein
VRCENLVIEAMVEFTLSLDVLAEEDLEESSF